MIYLTGIAVILIIGILATIIAKITKTSNILFLIVIGILIGNTPIGNWEIFQLSNTFLVGLAILALAMIVFDGSSRFSISEFDQLSTKTLELSILFMVFNTILITAILNIFYYNFTAQGILLGIVLGVIMAGTDPASIFILLGDKHHKVLQFLRVESLLNTPIMVIIPFLLVEIVKELNTGEVISRTIVEFITPFFQQIIVGIGTGVLIGIIVLKAMRKWYSESLSPVALLGAALISYILAENIGGNGVLAVAVLGLVFGNSYVRQKGTLQEFSSIVGFALQIMVFVLLGTMVQLPKSLTFWLASLTILLGTLVCRYVAINIIVKNEYSKKERLFMTLNIPKGIALAVVALTFAVTQELTLIVNFMIVLTIYSLIISSLIDRSGKYFLKFDIGQKK